MKTTSNNLRIEIDFVNDAHIRQLKKKYFNLDQITDVIAFPIKTQDSPKTYLLGSVVINLDQAKRQAKTHHVTLREEIARLASHGALHLLGLQDQTTNQKAKMTRLENKIIKSIDIHKQ